MPACCHIIQDLQHSFFLHYLLLLTEIIMRHLKGGNTQIYSYIKTSLMLGQEIISSSKASSDSLCSQELISYVHSPISKHKTLQNSLGGIRAVKSDLMFRERNRPISNVPERAAAIGVKKSWIQAPLLSSWEKNIFFLLPHPYQVPKWLPASWDLLNQYRRWFPACFHFLPKLSEMSTNM